ncbi:MAG: hypothetical protein ABSC17_11460 [Thermacetogeniaceae bacterium]
MSDLEKRSQKLSEAVTRLEQQKADALRDADRLSRQITAALMDGRDVGEVLIARQFQREMAEAIAPAIEDVRRQLEEVKATIEGRATQAKIDELQVKRDELRARYNEIDKLFKEQAWPQGRDKLIGEWDHLSCQIRTLNHSISELKIKYSELKISILPDRKRQPLQNAYIAVDPGLLEELIAELKTKQQRLSEIASLLDAKPSSKTRTVPLLAERRRLNQEISMLNAKLQPAVQNQC